MFAPRSGEWNEWHPPSRFGTHIGDLFHFIFVQIKGGSSIAKVVAVNLKMNSTRIGSNYMSGN